MKGLWFAGRELALDFASTLIFLVLYELTHSLAISIGLGIAVAVTQIGWKMARGHKIDALQWVSLVLVVMSGTATLVTNNPVFVMLKPSVIYVAVGWAMLQRGWMVRYMPPRAMELMPDLVIAFGYVWAAMMFFTAALNLVLGLTASVALWGTVMSAWFLFSKVVLFFIQYAFMRFIGHRRYHARHPVLLQPA